MVGYFFQTYFAGFSTLNGSININRLLIYTFLRSDKMKFLQIDIGSGGKIENSMKTKKIVRRKRGASESLKRSTTKYTLRWYIFINRLIKYRFNRIFRWSPHSIHAFATSEKKTPFNDENDTRNENKDVNLAFGCIENSILQTTIASLLGRTNLPFIRFIF